MDIPRLNYQRSSPPSPLRMLLMTAAVFMIEIAVMILVSRLPLTSPAEIFVDAALLTVLLLAPLYFLLYRPLHAHLTKHQQKEEEMDDLVVFFRNILDSIFSGVWVTNRLDTIFFANKYISEISGLPPDKLEGSSILTDFPEEMMRYFLPYYLKAKETLAPVYYDALPVKTPAGRESYQSGWLIPRLNDGRYNGMICTLEDVTSHKTAKAALRASEQRYKDLFENANDAIFIVDNNFNYLDVNKKAVDLFGFSKDEFLRMKITDVIPPGQRAHSDAEFDKLRRQGGYEHFIGKQRTKDGRWLDIEISSSAIFQDGKIAGSRDIVRDISERKHMEEQLRQAQKMEAIGTLAGGIAHDFNNILYAIRGYTELSLAETPRESPLRENLREINRSAKRAAELVKQILTFSRKAAEEKHPLRLQPVVKEALKLMRGTLPTTIDIRQDIDRGSRPIMADLTQIHQVVINLCSNAADAMEDNGGILTVQLEETTVTPDFAAQTEGLHAGDYVTLTVSDTGHGMDVATLSRIFDPYFTTKAPGKGTGLGLATVHGIISNHNGAIEVKSTPQQGTSFNIYFPVLTAEAVDSEGADHEPALLPVSGHILVVDDEEPIVRIAERALYRLGCEVTSFTSSTKALMAFQNAPYAFDAVLTDQTMPAITGLELARKILEIRPDIPIILTTGYSAAVNAEQAKEAGISAFLMKPLSLEDIAQALHQSLAAPQPAADDDTS